MEYSKGEKSIPCYRSIPIPFSAKVLDGIKREVRINGEGKEYTAYVMKFYRGVTFTLFFGKDKSGNKTLVDRVLDGRAGYKFSASKIVVTKEKDPDSGKKFTKIYLLASMQIPNDKADCDPKKVLYARTSLFQPLLCSTDKSVLEDPDSGKPTDDTKRVYDKNLIAIGSADEFLHRRLQIQHALIRARKSARYNRGGHGRNKKLASVDRFTEKEKRYIDYKTHLYSAILVKHALRRRCGTIVLLGTEDSDYLKKMENEMDKFILRNWSYYGLQQKIEYKAARYEIKVVVPKEKKENEGEE